MDTSEQTSTSAETSQPISPIGGQAPLISESSKEVKNNNDFNFRDYLSEEYKNNPSLKDYKDLNGFVKSYIEQQKLIGRSDIPKEGATQEELDKYYKKIGRPETADKYELDIKDLPEGFSLNEEGLQDFKKLAYQLGLTNKQAAELHKSYLSKIISNHKTPEQIDEEFLKMSNEEFGENADAIKENSKQLIEKHLSDKDRESLNDLSNKHLIIVAKLLNDINNTYIKEDSIKDGYKQAQTNETFRDELKEVNKKLGEINSFHPDFKRLSERRKELYSKGIKVYTS